MSLFSDLAARLDDQRISGFNASMQVREEAAVALREAEQLLREFLDASDDFVRSTGLKHGDAITEIAEKVRAMIG